MKNYIEIKKANEHNLKNVSLKFPKNKLVVFTGVSGSGKSSMAYDTIYAEGQRRYVESLSSYARQFLGIMNKPDVEYISGLSPAISIDQKKSSHNPRSTVGTITEIYDYLRLLFARVGHPHCPQCGTEIQKQSPQQITDLILELITKTAKTNQVAKFQILSQMVRDRKGEYNSLFDNLRGKGFKRVRVDGKYFDLDEDFVLIKTNKHTIDVVLERITFSKKETKDAVSLANLKSRLASLVEQALDLSGGLLIASQILDKGFQIPEKPKKVKDHLYSERFACPKDNISLPEIEPRTFSFNSPHGACPTCNGIGTQLRVVPELVVNPNLTIAQGAILPFARQLERDTWFKRTVLTIINSYNESPDTKWKHLPDSLKDFLLNSDTQRLVSVFGTNRFGNSTQIETQFEGITNILNRRYKESKSEIVRLEIEKYMKKEECSQCQGQRLKKEALSVTIDRKNIIQISKMQISSASLWMKKLKETNLNNREQTISGPITQEINNRLAFLESVGLEYITLDREASTLAGGEAQRIRLASQIGTGLSGVLYVLDEPTIGLHQRDNQRLIKTLNNLKDLGNTLVVVEHDRETIESADWIVDFGLGAGKHGGQVIAQGTLNQVKNSKKSLTGKYISGIRKIKTTRKKRKDDQPSHTIELLGCQQHNLKNIDIKIPLNELVCITGVSGSGKSTLLHDILYHALKRELNFLYKETPGKFKSIKGASEVSKVSLIDQSPIGRTPRSNPATYTKVFDHIRSLFAQSRESAVRGYKPGRFSFNVRGGRCEACQGAGSVKIEMQFLPDVYVTCEICKGTRFNSETREIKYRGLSIDQVLSLSVDEALTSFSHIPSIKNKLQTLSDVGLGYIELGQPATTLSGGESQRVKIAKELSVNSFGHTVYLLDEPTTGLHFADLEKLLEVLNKLVAKQNTVIIIEHNLDVIANADYIIDLGPEGGDHGGQVVASGSPKQIAANNDSHTGKFLKPLLSQS